MKNLKDYCVNERFSIKESISVIQNNFSRCVIVLNEHNKVTGVFSEGDVLRAILQNIDLHTPLKRILSPSFKYLNRRDLPEAYKLIKNSGITLIPVIDADFNLNDVITIFDVMDHLELVNA